MSANLVLATPRPEDLARAVEFGLPYAIEVRTKPVEKGLTPLPVPKRQPLPEYPLELRRHGVSGIATIRARIDVKGAVREVLVIRASRPEFAAAARKAVSAWSFDPAMDEGKPVDCAMDCTLEFRILDDEVPNNSPEATPGIVPPVTPSPSSGAPHL